MLLDRDHLLLRDEAVPAAQRLGVVRGIGVIGGHVGAHDARGVTSDVEAGAELFLGAHTGVAFRSEERRVWKECGSTCRTQWSTCTSKTKYIILDNIKRQ